MRLEVTPEVPKQTLAEVQREEAEAISLLVGLLDKVRETSITTPLESISKVVIQFVVRPSLQSVNRL